MSCFKNYAMRTSHTKTHNNDVFMVIVVFLLSLFPFFVHFLCFLRGVELRNEERKQSKEMRRCSLQNEKHTCFLLC